MVASYGSSSDQEYTSSGLNLGAESSDSILEDVSNTKYVSDEWTRSGLAVHTNVPARPRTWRSNSFGEKLQRRPIIIEETEDMDCGICFMNSVSPFRTKCCGKFFCYEHIHDWLNGPASDGRCPECRAPCSLQVDTPTSATLARPAIVIIAPTRPTNAQEALPDTPTTPVNKRATPNPLHIEVPIDTPKESAPSSPTTSTSSGSSSPRSTSSATSSTALTSMPSDEESSIVKPRARAYSDSYKPPFFREEKIDHAANLLRLKLLVSGVAARTSSSLSTASDDGSSSSRIAVIESESESDGEEVEDEVKTPPTPAVEIPKVLEFEAAAKLKAIADTPYIYDDEIDSSLQAAGRVLGLVGAMVICGTLLS